MHALKETATKGIFEVIGPITFKVGEELAFPGGVVKTFKTNLVLKSDFEKRGSEAADIELDFEKIRNMEAAFNDLLIKFQAMENKVSEKEDAFNQMETALNEAGGQIKKLTKENESLKKKIHSLEKPTETAKD